MRDRLIELLYCAGRDYDEYCDDSHEVGLSPMESFEEMAADHLLENGIVIVDPKKYPPITNRKIIETIIGVPLDEVAELIEAKQEGRIIVPPCKVGDTVYTNINGTGLHNSFRVESVDLLGFSNGLYYWTWHQLGKSVFLTLEQAEKALAERSKE